MLQACISPTSPPHLAHISPGTLQACGADLLAAWPLLLSVLWRAATLPALASLLPLGFRSVQLVASDFLSVLPLTLTLTLTLSLALT